MREQEGVVRGHPLPAVRHVSAEGITYTSVAGAQTAGGGVKLFRERSPKVPITGKGCLLSPHRRGVY